MKKNARRAIVMAVLFAAIAGATSLLTTRSPDMHIASVNPERIVLEAGGPCDYDIWLNHTPECDDCRYYDGVSIISATNFSRLTVYWNATSLVTPTSGDCFCGNWHCRDEVGWHGGELWDTIAWRLWLPMVWKE